MRTAIIAAMEEEIQYLRQHITNYEMYEFQGYEYHIGEINNHKVVVARSGIGKVNAALSTSLLLDHFKVTEVINTGSAGAIDSKFNVGDIILAKDCVFHDVDATHFDYAYGQVPKMPARYDSNVDLLEDFQKILNNMNIPAIIGTIGTGDSFITDKVKFNQILELIPDISAVEMEAAAITQVCYQYQVPFIVVRSISDIVGANSNMEFYEYLDMAVKNSTEVIVQYLNNK